MRYRIFSSRIEVEIFYYFITLVFCLFPSITFLNFFFHKTNLAFCSMNVQLFVMIGINTFFGNKSYKVVTSCLKKAAQTLSQLFINKLN